MHSFKTNLPDRFSIDKIQISKVNKYSTMETIEAAINKKIFGYICVTNSRTVYLANNDPNYCKIQNNSLLTVPDGMPLVWIANNLGYNNVKKVSGKDLMDLVFCKSEKNKYSHYFYGCSQNTIDLLCFNLSQLYPNIEIKRAYSPPFQSIEKFDIDALAEEINLIHPTFFWCGLGAPKQEQLIALLQPKLESTICIGVGLAFEYFAGTVDRAPSYISNNGLEWMYRLMQQPERISYTGLKRIFNILIPLTKSYFHKSL